MIVRNRSGKKYKLYTVKGIFFLDSWNHTHLLQTKSVHSAESGEHVFDTLKYYNFIITN